MTTKKIVKWDYYTDNVIEINKRLQRIMRHPFSMYCFVHNIIKWYLEVRRTCWGPPRSPCLKPQDFFLWGFLKDKVYETKLTGQADLLNPISVACKCVTQIMLRKVQNELYSNMIFCIAARGSHFEQVLLWFCVSACISIIKCYILIFLMFYLLVQHARYFSFVI